MKKILLSIVALLAIAQGLLAQNIDYSQYKGKLNFYVCNDMGRNGYYDQKPIAELMGQMAENIGIECVVAAGDIHHFWGVESTSDPLWRTNYEDIYTHPELMLPWYPILGNHEYRGNTQAVLDYAKVSRRWMMEGRYYTKVLTGKGVTVGLVLVDTTPMIESYRQESETYPDACKQDLQAQLSWIDKTLASAKEDWVIVIGHHPLYADTPKSESERTDMQNRLLPILKRHKVDMYINGHIHNFQQIHKNDVKFEMVTNSAASLSRPSVKAIDDTVFCSGEPGFSILSATPTSLELRMIDKHGNVLTTIARTRL